MKSKVTFYLIKWRVASQEWDDSPDYRFPPEEVTIEYRHFFINKKHAMKKAINKYIQKLEKWPYSIVASFNKDYNGTKILDGSMLDPEM
jgi:hypothetical protein